MWVRSINDVMSTAGKDVWINLRVNPRIREEFKAAADIRGASMSSLLHQYMIKVIREEKDKNLADFTVALDRIRAAGDFDANSIGLSGVSHGSSSATMDLTVTKAEPSGPLANHVYDAIAGTPKAAKGKQPPNKGGGKGKKP